jgi:cyanate permease
VPFWLQELAALLAALLFAAAIMKYKNRNFYRIIGLFLIFAGIGGILFTESDSTCSPCIYVSVLFTFALPFMFVIFWLKASWRDASIFDHRLSRILYFSIIGIFFGGFILFVLLLGLGVGGGLVEGTYSISIIGGAIIWHKSKSFRNMESKHQAETPSTRSMGNKE